MTSHSRRTALLGLVAALGLPGAARAQEGDVLVRLRQLARRNGALYVAPLGTGLGLALTQGTLFRASPQGLLHFDIGVAFAATVFPERARTFEPFLPVVRIGGRTYRDPYLPGSVPTAVGESRDITLQLTPELQDSARAHGIDPGSLALTFPGGLDIPLVPFAVLQGSVGLPLGTEVALRLVPEVTITDDVGTLSSFGFSLKHSLSQYIPGSPVELSALFARQGLEVGDYLEGATTAFGLALGKGIGPLALFATGTSESGSMQVGYTYQGADPTGNPGERVAFETDIEGGTRITAGATLSFLWLRLSAAYSVADYDGFALKALISLP